MTATVGRTDALFVGRNEQLELFEPIKEKVIGGASAVVGVSGRAGTGKTVLMWRLAATLGSAVFGYGKYDAVRTRPYEGIASALTEVVAHMAASPQRVAWESELRGSLGEGAPTLAALVPELSNVLDIPTETHGARPEENPDSEAMLLALQQAVTALVLSTAHHASTLTLMIDDLQWAGRNTLSLLKKLGDASIPGLLVLGAWRDQERESAEKYTKVFDQIVMLEGFGRGSLAELFTAHAGHPPDPPVLETLVAETGGNPQFVAELINNDLADDSLQWDEDTERWRWVRVDEASDLIGGLERLLLDRLERMPAADADLIAAAAALGTVFNAADLAAATGERPERVRELLASPAARSFLVGVGQTETASAGQYRFAHDRIAEITARRLSPSQRKEASVRLARDLIDSDRGRISDALIHLSAGTDIVTDESERLQMARLSVDAGNDARRKAAFSIALRHFQTGLDLVSQSKADRDLVSNLSVGATEAAWLCGDERIGDLLRRASLDGSTLVDRARLTTVEMKLGLAGYGGLRPENALQHGLEMLQELGIELPKRPSNAGVLNALLRTRRRLADHSIQDLANLESSHDPESIWAEQVLGEMFSTSYAVDPELFPFVVLEAVNLTLDRGRLPMTPVALAAYGLLLVVVADNPLLEKARPKLATRFYKEALEFGHLAVRMADYKESIRYRPWTHFLYYDFISHWQYPIRDNLDAIRAAAKEALEVGDPAYGAYLGDVETGQMVAVGFSMAELDQRCRAILTTMGPGQDKQYELAEILVQLAENLAHTGDAPPYVIAGTTGYDEKDVLSRPGEDAVSLSVLWNTKLELAVLSGHYEVAPRFADETGRYLSGLAGTTIVPLHHMLNAYGRVKAEPDRRSTRSALKTALRKYERWQHLAPSNYRAGYELLLGLDGLLARKVEEAKRHLFEAVNTSQADKLPIVNALSHLAIADLVTDEEEIESHVLAAGRVWASMGNVAGLEMLQASHPEIHPLIALKPDQGSLPSTASSLSPELPREALKALGLEEGAGSASASVRLRATVLCASVSDRGGSAYSMTSGEQEALSAGLADLLRDAARTHRGWMLPGGQPHTVVFGSSSDAVVATLAILDEHTRRNQRAISTGAQPIEISLRIRTGEIRVSSESGGFELRGPAVDEARQMTARRRELDSPLVTDEETAALFASQGQELDQLDAAGRLFGIRDRDLP